VNRRCSVEQEVFRWTGGVQVNRRSPVQLNTCSGEQEVFSWTGVQLNRCSVEQVFSWTGGVQVNRRCSVEQEVFSWTGVQLNRRCSVEQVFSWTGGVQLNRRCSVEQVFSWTGGVQLNRCSVEQVFSWTDVQVGILQMTEHQKLPNLVYFRRNFQICHILRPNLGFNCGYDKMLKCSVQMASWHLTEH
jgi:hypothetical protein